MKYIFLNKNILNIAECYCGDNCSSQCKTYKRGACIPNCPGYTGPINT